MNKVTADKYNKSLLTGTIRVNYKIFNVLFKFLKIVLFIFKQLSKISNQSSKERKKKKNRRYTLMPEDVCQSYKHSLLQYTLLIYLKKKRLYRPSKKIDIYDVYPSLHSCFEYNKIRTLVIIFDLSCKFPIR